MKLVSNIEHILALPQNIFRLTIVNRRWRQQAYAGVTVLVVVPPKKTLTENTTILEAPKAARGVQFAMAQTAQLKKKVAKDALENLDWPKLTSHLDEIVLDEDKFSVLLGHMRLSPDSFKGSFASSSHFALFRVDRRLAAARTGVSDCAGFAPNINQTRLALAALSLTPCHPPSGSVSSLRPCRLVFPRCRSK